MWLGIIFFIALVVFIFPGAVLSFLKPYKDSVNKVEEPLQKAKATLRYYSPHYQCWVCEFHDEVLRFGHLFCPLEDYSIGQKIDIVRQELSESGHWTVKPL